MSQQDRVDAVRTTVARELALVDHLLARVSDPGLKTRIGLLRRDLDEVEPVFLKGVASSPTPEVLLFIAEQWSAGLVSMREDYEGLIKQYGSNVKLIG